MAGSFLDTTIVVHVSDPKNPEKAKSDACILANQPAEAPYYALRELLAGHLRNLCEAHNAIQASDNPAEALISILQKLFRAGRKKDSVAKAISESLSDMFAKRPGESRDLMKQECMEDLALRINRMWRNSHAMKKVDLVQSLSCFNDGKLSYGQAGELRAPGNSFNCLQHKRCAAAAYLYDQKNDLQIMIDALHPNNLDPSIAGKTETNSRRKALKELQSKGPNEFSKAKCRALGDAYFAAMCPPGKVVVSSNLVDHLPLCVALSKTAVEP